MAMRFEVGQRVRVVMTSERARHCHGRICTLTAYLGTDRFGNDRFRTDMVRSARCFGLLKRYWKGPSFCFAPIDRPPMGSWEETGKIWRPEGVGV